MMGKAKLDKLEVSVARGIGCYRNKRNGWVSERDGRLIQVHGLLRGF